MIHFHIRQAGERRFQTRDGQRYPTAARSRLTLKDLRVVEIDLLDISISGFRAECGAAVTPGEVVALSIGDRAPLKAKIRWRREGQIGCAFQENLDWPVLMSLLDLFSWYAQNDTPTAAEAEDGAFEWIATDAREPSGEVLVFTDNACCVAVLVRNPDDPAEPPIFMDARTSDLIRWPSHWMPLPKPPRD